MASSEDFFEDSLLSLFDQHPFAFSTSGPNEPYIYKPPLPPTSHNGNNNHPPSRHLPISLRLPVAPSSLHLQLQLTHIWLSSIYLADLIFLGEIQVEGKRCAELGAGAGLPSIAALRSGAKEVVASDYAVERFAAKADRGTKGKERENVDVKQEEDVLGVLRGNLKTACPTPEWKEGKHWDVVGHTWGTDPKSLLSAPSTDHHSKSEGKGPGKFDILLLADLLWSSASHTALTQSILSLLRRPLCSSSTSCFSPKRSRSTSSLPSLQDDPDEPDPPPSAHLVSGLHQGRGPLNRFLAVWTSDEVGGWAKERREVRWGRSGGWESYKRRKREKRDQFDGGGGGGADDEGARKVENDAEGEIWEVVDVEQEKGVVVWMEIGLFQSEHIRNHTK